MSNIPRELRDRVVSKLERAVADRDRQLDHVRRDADRLQNMMGGLEGQIRQQEQLSRQLQREIEAAEQELVQEQQRALQRLRQLRREMEQQHARLQAELRAAQERHRRDWERIRSEIEQLAAERREKEQRLRHQALRAAGKARERLASIEPEEAEALDLAGDLTVAIQQLESAKALLSDHQNLPGEQMSAALGAEESALRVQGLANRRRGELTAHAESIRDASNELDELVSGGPLGELGDQREAVESLLPVEADQMKGMIQRFLREASRRLERWNGHAALLARLTAIRDLIGTEILGARQCLGTAMEHEEGRYNLDSIWDDLEVRFGRIQDLGEETEGAWSDPSDRKSTYLFFLDSPSGEVLAEVPWAGPIVITHEERRLFEFPPTGPLVTHPEVVFIGNLRSRWIEVERRLENPNWNPDQHLEEVSA